MPAVKFLSVSVTVRWWLTQSVCFAYRIWITPHFSADFTHHCTVHPCFTASHTERYKWLNTAVCFIIGSHTHKFCINLLLPYPASCIMSNLLFRYCDNSVCMLIREVSNSWDMSRCSLADQLNKITSLKKLRWDQFQEMPPTIWSRIFVFLFAT